MYGQGRDHHMWDVDPGTLHKTLDNADPDLAFSELLATSFDLGGPRLTMVKFDSHRSPPINRLGRRDQTRTLRPGRRRLRDHGCAPGGDGVAQGRDADLGGRFRHGGRPGCRGVRSKDTGTPSAASFSPRAEDTSRLRRKTVPCGCGEHTAGMPVRRWWLDSQSTRWRCARSPSPRMGRHCGPER